MPTPTLYTIATTKEELAFFRSKIDGTLSKFIRAAIYEKLARDMAVKALRDEAAIFEHGSGEEE